MSLTADQMQEAIQMMGILDASAGYPEYHNLLVAAKALVRELPPETWCMDIAEGWGSSRAIDEKRNELAEVITCIEAGRRHQEEKDA